MKLIVKLIYLILTLNFIYFILFTKIIFNTSISEPQGYYFVYKAFNYNLNDKVLICIYDKDSLNIMHNLKLPFENGNCGSTNTPYLIKTIVAKVGDKVDIKELGIFINNKFYLNSRGESYAKNIKLNPLPNQSLILKDNEYFMLGQTPHSYDSRYFGIIKKSQIFFKAILICHQKKPYL